MTIDTLMESCHLLQFGRMDYRSAWDMQIRLADARAKGEIDDTLVLLEHPHTYTLGRSGHLEHLLMREDELAERGIAVVEADRGGDITYHGPGQLVAYPILSLGEPDATGRLVRADYINYLRKLEAVTIRLLSRYHITGLRVDGYTGVWVEGSAGLAKIAAIGVRVNARGVSMHGTAININPDMRYFAGIVPCGIADKPVTSLSEVMEKNLPDMPEITDQFCAAFEAVFDCRLLPNEGLKRRVYQVDSLL